MRRAGTGDPTTRSCHQEVPRTTSSRGYDRFDADLLAAARAPGFCEARRDDAVLATALLEVAFLTALRAGAAFLDRAARDGGSAPLLGNPCATRLYPTGLSLYWPRSTASKYPARAASGRVWATRLGSR